MIDLITNLPDFSPESAAITQSFAFSIAQNLIASAIVEWKNLKDKSTAQENADLLANFEHSKTLESRIAQKIVGAFRKIELSVEQSNCLLDLLKDAELTSAIAKTIISDTCSADTIVDLIYKYHPSTNADNALIAKIAFILFQSIQSGIADDTHLFRVKQLHFQTKVTAQISNLSDELAVSFDKTQGSIDRFASSLQTMIESSVKSAMAEGSQEAEHLKTQNQKRFDRARQELIQRSLLNAENEFRSLVTDLEQLGNLADKKLLFRSYTNLGSSLWQQCRNDEAVVWFEKAYAINPGDQKAQSNKAIVHIHRKEFEQAIAILRTLKAQHPDSFDAAYLTACAYLEQGKVNHAITELNNVKADTVEYFEALAQAYLRAEDYQNALTAAKNALLKNESSRDAMICLAYSLGFPVVQRRLRREADSFSITAPERLQISEAIRVGQMAVTMCRKQDRQFQLGELLTNMSVFYELADNQDLSEKMASEAAELHPKNVISITNLWASKMRSGKYIEAYRTAARMIEVGDKLTGKMHQLEALLLNSDYERLLIEADETEYARELSKQPRFSEIRAQAQFEINQVDPAFQTVSDAVGRFPDNSSLLCIRASFYEELGNFESAQKDLESAESLTGGKDPRVLWHAAIFYYHRHDWAAAASRFSKLGGESIYSPLLDSYLICLHNLARYVECFKLAVQAISATAAFNPTLEELAGRCAYNANELPAAAKHFERLVHHNPPNVVDYQKMLAEVYLRLDELEKAAGILKKAGARKPKDVSILIGRSFIHALAKENQNAVQYAFEAVQMSDKNVQANTALVRAVLDCPPDFKLENKHRKAFERSLEFLQKHPTGFIKAIPLENDLKTFIEMAKSRAERANSVQKLIREKKLPMSILGVQMGVSPFQTWICLTGNVSLNVFMAYGTTDEQVKEVEAAGAAEIVCVDVFALFTLRLLGHLDLLKALYPRIVVHTSILEAIVGDIREMEARKTFSSVGYREGQLFLSESSPEQIKVQISFLKDIRDFLKSDSVELVGLDAEVYNKQERHMALKVLGTVYYTPILVAKERKAMYFGDDAPTRSLASNSYGVTAFCSQALLRTAKKRNLLTEAQYEDALIMLLRYNYFFVSETADTLKRLVELEKFQPSDLSRLILNRVNDPRVDQNAAVQILSNFCFLIWRVDLSAQKGIRKEWLALVVKSLLSVKQPEVLFAQFLVNLGVCALNQPAVFGGITQWIEKSGELSMYQRRLFSMGVQECAIQMRVLAEKTYPWSRALINQWIAQIRINRLLEKWQNFE